MKKYLLVVEEGKFNIYVIWENGFTFVYESYENQKNAEKRIKEIGGAS